MPDDTASLNELVHVLTTLDLHPESKSIIPDMWYLEDTLRILSPLRKDPARWGYLAAHAKRQGIDPFNLARAVDALATNGQTPDDFDPFVLTDSASILATNYPPQRWLVSGLIPDGLTILGGSPKSGKSYVSYGLALAVCRPALWCEHWKTDEGVVVYVALEDEPRNSAQRMGELAPGLRLAPGKLYFIHGLTNVPSFDSGFIAWVEGILKTLHPRLLIIDPISYLYAIKRSGSQFEETRDMLLPLRWLGITYQCAILCDDHRRKRSTQDVSIFDTLHGSVAKIAVADSLLMIEREESEITMKTLVRQGKDQTIHIDLSFPGEGVATLAVKERSEASHNYGAVHQSIYTFLMQTRTPQSVTDIMAACDFVDTRAMRHNVKMILMRGHQAHELERTERGRYVWAVEAYKGETN